MSRKIVVIGAGQAAIAFAAKLRELDTHADITLIGDEPSLPYQRPPLSKKYMTGEMTADRLLLRPADWYQDERVTCLTGKRAVEISPEKQLVTLENGELLEYDKLLLATGSTPRKLSNDIGGDLDGVHTLRHIADADAIGSDIEPGNHLLVLGGGYIGLEVASVAIMRGLKVTIIEMAERILNRVASETTAEYFRQLHQAKGVEILEGTAIKRLVGKNGRVCGAELPDGSVLSVDTVVAGIGITPNVKLAEEAGLKIDNGIMVDASTRTSNENIHAAGDCASFEFRGAQIRLESVQNAIDQAEAAAYAIAGDDIRYKPVPWFWSDQYDTKLQIAGFNLGYDHTVIRPGSREGAQSVWYFAQNRFVAVDAMNDPKPYMFGKRLLELDREITAEQAENPHFDLKSLFR